MASWPHATAILIVLFFVSENDGFRFQYYKRHKPKTLKYTPYAYNNYIPYSVTKGWSQSSSYIKFAPDVHNSRTYKFYRGQYTPHINMYFAMASSETYKNRRISEDALVCSNYDANDYGDVMGIFACPNAWEPSNFTACCGQDYAEFCCDQRKRTSSWVTILAATVGIFTAIVIVVAVVLVCLHKRKRLGKTSKSPSFTGRLHFAVKPKLNLADHSRGREEKQAPTSQPSYRDDGLFAYNAPQ